MRNYALVLVAVAAALGSAAHNANGHFDIAPYAAGGKVMTGGHDDGTLENAVELQVFGFDFGEEPSDPYFIGDPGFNNGGFAIGVFPNDGLLPTGQTLSFNLTTNLEYWDGTGAVNFSAAPADVELGLIRGSFSTYLSGSGATGTPPTIGPTGASGRLHVHLGSELRYQGSSDPSAPNAPDGLYLIGMTLSLNGLQDSDPFYIVYNNGLSEELHDTGMAWVQSTLVVPEPQTWLMLGTALVGLMAMGRRRLHRSRTAA
jgi:hypothetical protein